MDDNITTTERLLSSLAGSLITSFFVTPLDVVKVRLQAQMLEQNDFVSGTRPVRISKPCRHYMFNNGLMEHLCLKVNCPAFMIPQKVTFNGAYDAAVKIVKYEGAFSLWRGLSPTLFLALPATVLYFTTYDEMKIYIERKMKITQNSFWIPMLSGGVARIVAATAVSPLELIRTQLQASNKHESKKVFSKLKNNVSSNGVLTLWRGLTPTLLRDVPFSMSYWIGYEKIKILAKAIVDRNGYFQDKPYSAELAASFAGGLISGSIAAAVTTPLDVIKTRSQVDFAEKVHFKPYNTREAVKEIIKIDGWSGLLVGLGPRVARVAPSCAIMIASYELGKMYFRRNKE